MVPAISYAKSGDVHVAYRTIGDGPVDLVLVPGWVSHLEAHWDDPLLAHFLERLSRFSRLILFDKRGTGLSDPVPLDRLPTLEERMDDVRAVLDAVGSRTATLFGISEGGPMCALYAATYPERTSALVMSGCYAKWIRADDYPWAPTRADHDAAFAAYEQGWGTPIGFKTVAPSVANVESCRNWWARNLRQGASPGAGLALYRMNIEIDIRALLPGYMAMGEHGMGEHHALLIANCLAQSQALMKGRTLAEAPYCNRRSKRQSSIGCGHRRWRKTRVDRGFFSTVKTTT